MNPIFKKLFSYDAESNRMISWLGKYAQGQRVLDVGCGYGRLMKQAKHLKIEFHGVEINPQTVTAMIQSGFRVFTPDEFSKSTGQYDLIVMSHVIEHFEPNALLRFMDFYLDRLDTGGRLFIATPLMSSSFYNDFDHVKPYQPAAIQAVFSGMNPQVQYHGKTRLKLVDLWFRKSYYRGNYFRSNYLFPSFGTKILRAFELMTAFVVFASGGRIGIKSGWVGVFEKIQ